MVVIRDSHVIRELFQKQSDPFGRRIRKIRKIENEFHNC